MVEPTEINSTTGRRVPRRTVLKSLAVSGGVLGLGVGSVSGQQNIINNCGTVITSPGTYTLGQDLTATAGQECIRIESSDVTLDGNDHIISGSDTDAVTVDGFAGGDDDPLENVTVQNVGVQDLQSAIRFLNVCNSTARVNTMADLEVAGVELFECFNVTAQANFVGNSGTGIVLTDTSGSPIFENEVNGSEFNGIELNMNETGSNENEILENISVSNGFSGISLSGSDENEIDRNVATDNDEYGLAFDSESNDNSAEENDLTNNTLGAINDQGTGNTFANNQT